MDVPTGTVTFLFTDIEGSTQLWEQQPEAMSVALQQHDALLRQGIEAHGGYIFQTVGDAFHATFVRPDDALTAALALQQALQAAEWGPTGPLRVRMALHTGPIEERGGDYFGRTVNRVARLVETGHGGQILLSLATYELTRDELAKGVTVKALDTHRLKDLVRPETIYQINAPGASMDFPPLESLDSYPHNLPIQPTLFIGRTADLTQVKDLLASERLVTLTGPGGTGKTRLALQVGADLVETYRNGVWLVELAPLTDGALVLSTTAAALGVREMAGQTLQETLVAFLRDKELVLVLDNSEHLLDASAQLADTLLRQCPQVRLLVTSRAPLGIGGERVWGVPPLAIPEAALASGLDIETLSQYESVQLFIDRAQAVQPAFAVTHANAPALAQLCVELEGLPLAIELAAVRVTVLSVEQIQVRLADRFRLLTGGSRVAARRQQTLEAAIDWSYDLLAAPEQTLFRRLSVFQGGWTLAAAEAVTVDGGLEVWDVLEGLSQLVDQSLVRLDEPIREAPESAVRYSMLETVRQYGQQRRRQQAEETDVDVEAAHGAYYRALAERLGAQLWSPEELVALKELDVELGNLRAAQDFAQGQQDGSLLGALGQALVPFYELRGLWAEGLERLRQAATALPAETVAPVQAQVQLGLGKLHRLLGAYDPARDCAMAALDQARGLDAPSLIAAAQHSLAVIASTQGAYDEAQALATENLQLSRELGDRKGVAMTLNNLGNIAEAQGAYDEAQALTMESLQLSRELGDREAIAQSLNNLGAVAHAQGDLAEAQRLFTESLQLSRELGDRQGIGMALNNLGEVAHAQDDLAEAQRLFTESLQLKRELGDREGIAFTLNNLGTLALDQQAPAQALSHLSECLPLVRDLNFKELMAHNLYQWGRLAAGWGALDCQVGWLLTAARLFAELGSTESEKGQKVQVALDELQQTQDAAWFQARQQETQALSTEQVLDQILGEAEVHKTDADKAEV